MAPPIKHKTEDGETYYQKHKETFLRVQATYRNKHRAELAQNSKANYWENPGVRERKIEQMRLYRQKKKLEKIEAKMEALTTEDEKPPEPEPEPEPEDPTRRKARLARNREKREARKQFQTDMKALKEEEPIVMV